MWHLFSFLNRYKVYNACNVCKSSVIMYNPKWCPYFMAIQVTWEPCPSIIKRWWLLICLLEYIFWKKIWIIWSRMMSFKLRMQTKNMYDQGIWWWPCLPYFLLISFFFFIYLGRRKKENTFSTISKLLFLFHLFGEREKLKYILNNFKTFSCFFSPLFG